MQPFRRVSLHLKAIKPEVYFLIFAIIFGTAFSLITPVFRAPDEETHLRRAYQISELRLLPMQIGGVVGGYVPKSLIDLSRLNHFRNPDGGQMALRDYYRHYGSQRLDARKTSLVEFGNTAQASPLVYAPQAIGLAIGRTMNANPMTTILLGRLFNLLVFILMVYLAIRYAPIGKWVFFAVSLTPIALQQAGSLSPDAFTNGLAMLFIALALRAVVNARVLSRKNWIIFFILAAAIGLAKIPTLLITLLLFAVPVSRGHRKYHYLLTSGLVVLSVVVAAAWLFAARSFVSTEIPSQGSSFAHQLAFIFQEPIHYAGVITNTYLSDWGDIYITGTIGNLGLLELPVRQYDVVIGFIVIFCSLIASNVAAMHRFMPWQRIIWGGIYITVVLAITTLLYLTWTSVGGSRVGGIQSRYFMCFIPMLILIFANTEICLRSGDKWVKLLVVTGTFVVLVTTASRMINYYY